MPALPVEHVDGLIATGATARMPGEVAAGFRPGDRVSVRNLLPPPIRGCPATPVARPAWWRPTAACSASTTPMRTAKATSRSTCTGCGSQRASCGASRLRPPIRCTWTCSKTTSSRIADLAALPPIPSDESGPMFREPWEAQAFALVVALHQAGHFTWPEWVELISAEIRQAQAEGDPDLGRTYYRHWLAALERIVVDRRLADDVDLHLRRLECAANLSGQHGHPARREPVRIGEDNGNVMIDIGRDQRYSAGLPRQVICPALPPRWRPQWRGFRGGVRHAHDGRHGSLDMGFRSIRRSCRLAARRAAWRGPEWLIRITGLTRLAR